MAWHGKHARMAADCPKFIRTARDAVNLFEPLFDGWINEKLVVAYLAVDRRLLKLGEVEGCRVEVSVPARLIVACALDIDAHGLILAHNHPSGDPSPSEADLHATRRLITATEVLGIAVHDHLIFGGGDCRSLRAMGLL